MLEKTSDFQNDKLEFMKNPFIVEFWRLAQNIDYVETNEDIERYFVTHGNEQLFASSYKLYLPTEKELRAEIEIQKAMFFLQQGERENTQTDLS